MLAFLFLPGLWQPPGSLSVLLRVAEIGLVPLLFTNASRTDHNFTKLTIEVVARGALP